MLNPIKTIVQWNQQAGLLDTGYDDFLESSFQVEEALEGFSNLPALAKQVLVEDSVTGYDNYGPKEISRAIVALVRMDGDVTEYLSDVDRLGKHCDGFVYNVGSMAKLGLNAQQITQAVNIVMEANMQKLQCKTDSAGKLGKPADFITPGPKLQLLLDKRVVDYTIY